MRKSLFAVSMIVGLSFAGSALAQNGKSPVKTASPILVAKVLVAMPKSTKTAGEAERKEAARLYGLAKQAREQAKLQGQKVVEHLLKAIEQDKFEAEARKVARNLTIEAWKIDTKSMRADIVTRLKGDAKQAHDAAKKAREEAAEFEARAKTSDERAKAQEEAAAKLVEAASKPDAAMQAAAANLRNLATADRAAAKKARDDASAKLELAKILIKSGDDKLVLAANIAAGKLTPPSVAANQTKAANLLKQAEASRTKAEGFAKIEADFRNRAKAAGLLEQNALKSAAGFAAKAAKLWVEGLRDDMAQVLRTDASRLLGDAQINERTAANFAIRASTEESRAKSQEEAAAKLADPASKPDAAMLAAAKNLRDLAAKDREAGKALGVQAAKLAKLAAEQRKNAADKLAEAKKLDPNGK